MFCPVCRDEYRPGFTRCAGCDVDLVNSLDDAIVPEAPELVSDRHLDEPLRNFCGFLSLDEARAARDKVRASGVRVEILICEAPGASTAAPIAEEYWLRVMPSDARAVATLIEFDPGVVAAADGADDDAFNCSACGAVVRASDDKCPGCGLGFEE